MTSSLLYKFYTYTNIKKIKYNFSTNKEHKEILTTPRKPIKCKDYCWYTEMTSFQDDSYTEKITEEI